MFYRVLQKARVRGSGRLAFVVAYWPGSTATGQPVHIEDFVFAYTPSYLTKIQNSGVTINDFVRRLIVQHWREWRAGARIRDSRTLTLQAGDVSTLDTLTDEAEVAGE